ncbi:ABC transporter permease, partial [Pedococcus sp. P5_B7]
PTPPDDMVRYIATRLLALLLTLLVLSFLAFVFVRALPGDPATAILGPNASRESIERLHEALGLNRPLLEQYGEYMHGLLRGDLGVSAVSQRPISEEIRARLPATIELALAAIGFGAPIGIVMGRRAARHPGSLLDSSITTATIAAISVPVFVLGLLLQYVLAVRLQLFPAIGRISNPGELHANTGFVLLDSLLSGHPAEFVDGLRHLVLPVLTLAVIPIAVVARVARAAYINEAHSPHVRIARAKGITERRARHDHIARNSWPPIVIVVGLQFGALLSGAIITENVFGWGGLGSLIVSSIRNNDYPVIQSILLVLAATYVLVNLVVDLINAQLDPRLRSNT